MADEALTYLPCGLQMYGEITVRGGETLVRLNVRKERFTVVMAAIASHSAGQAVTLDFQRCD